MIALSAVDYISVAIYLVAIAAFGSSFYRRKSTAREYFLGGRSMGWLPAGISIVAADLSAITVMGAPAWAYKHNLELWLVAFGYPLVAPIVIFVFVPFYSRLNLYTAYEYLERRFSLSVRLVVSALFQMLRAWHVAVAIYGPALVINLVTGLPVWECVLAMGLFTTFYTSLGGVKAVIWTDVIQFVTVTTGVLLILTIALAHVPGGLPAAFSTVRAAGRLQIINLSTDPTQLTSLWACLFGRRRSCPWSARDGSGNFAAPVYHKIHKGLPSIRSASGVSHCPSHSSVECCRTCVVCVLSSPPRQIARLDESRFCCSLLRRN